MTECKNNNSMLNFDMSNKILPHKKNKKPYQRRRGCGYGGDKGTHHQLIFFSLSDTCR
jgi:hypothetical protein